MSDKFRNRRLSTLLFSLIFLIIIILTNTSSQIKTFTGSTEDNSINEASYLVTDILKKIPVKGRAPKTNYSREEFGNGWMKINGCDMRNIILNRDLNEVVVDINCNVTSGVLDDPYTGKTITFIRGSNTSDDIQIDHVVSLSDAWQKGAQQLSKEKRIELANDPLELLAVDGQANQQKGDGDAATWLPSNKSFRCQYVSRQVAVKYKYDLWITQSEYDAIERILDKCPGQLLPKP